jgi:hypothetical protein
MTQRSILDSLLRLLPYSRFITKILVKISDMQEHSDMVELLHVSDELEHTITARDTELVAFTRTLGAFSFFSHLFFCARDNSRLGGFLLQ